MQRKIRVDDTDACDRRQVQPARHQLSADQDVRTTLAERLPNVEVRVRPARDVAVQAQHARHRPQLLDHPLEALRPHAETSDVARTAEVAHRWHLPRVAAVVTDESIDFGVLHERNRAAQALHRFAAVSAHDEGSHPAPIQVEDGLLLVVEGLRHYLDQAPRQRLTVAFRRLVPHVHKLDIGVAAAHPLGQRGGRDGAAGRLEVGGDARSRRPCNQARPCDRGKTPGHPTRLVARRPILLVGCGTLLVQADEPQARDRRENRRPAAQHHLRLASSRPPPLLGPLQLGQLRVQDGDRGVQASPYTLDQLGRQRDLRHEQQDAQSIGQRSLRRGQIDLRLAACDHAVQEGHRVGPDHLQGGALLFVQLDVLRGWGRAGRQLEEAGMPPLPARSFRSGRPGAPNSRREHGSDALDQRHPVVVGDQTRERHLVRQQQRIGPGRFDRLGLDARLLGAQRHDESVGAATPKRHRHTVPGNQVDSFRHLVCVGLARDPAGGLHRHFRVEGQPTSSA